MSDTLRDEPRSWVAVVRDGLAAHAAALWLAAFLFFSLLAALAAATALHINGVTIGAIAAAEAEAGKSIAAGVHPQGVYLSVALHTITAAACLHSYVSHR